MKHTTFENELREIRRRAVQELKEALAAHNGRYDYTQYEFSPTIRGEKVKEARLYDGEYIFVDTSESYVALGDKCLTIEEIISLTDYIEPTDEVNDVSGVYPLPVTWVDCDDIEMQGFDTSDVTQEKLNEIAERMQDYYCDSSEFSSNLYDACIACGLKDEED